MRSSSPLRILMLTTLLVAAAAGLLLASAPAHADPATAPAAGVWPLDPRPDVLAGFDPPQSSWGAGHRGVDLTGHVGQRVRAAEPGRVTFAGTLAGRGVVVVDHGGTRTTYEPVTASVAVGDTVGAGAALGRLELFGSHCFPRACLHWGLIEGRDHYLDPLTLVGAGPIRLLPLTGGLDPLVGPPGPVMPAVRAAATVSGPRMRLAEGLP
jgi:murein DD-endopeptidase MepM/ murein hydrolase activator NlpD